MERLLKVVETYRADTEEEVKTLINEAKADSSFELIKYSSEYKEKKSKGEVIDAAWLVQLHKGYSSLWEE